MRVFDTHCHVISRDENLYPVSPLGGKRSTWSVERPADCAELLAEMDRANVGHAAVVQASTVYGHDNSYVADSVTAHPDHLVGIASADFRDPDAVGLSSKWIDEGGLVGLRLFTSGSTMQQAGWLDSEETFPAWEWAAAAGVPVCVQAEVSAIPQLVNVVRRVDEIKIILDHMCRLRFANNPIEDVLAPVLALSDMESFYLKLTTNNLRSIAAGAPGRQRLGEILVNSFGSSRIMWGSNYPATDGTLGEHVELLNEALAGLPEQDAQSIASGTAEVLYLTK